MSIKYLFLRAFAGFRSRSDGWLSCSLVASPIKPQRSKQLCLVHSIMMMTVKWTQADLIHACSHLIGPIFIIFFFVAWFFLIDRRHSYRFTFIFFLIFKLLICFSPSYVFHRCNTPWTYKQLWFYRCNLLHFSRSLARYCCICSAKWRDRVTRNSIHDVGRYSSHPLTRH